MPRRSDRISQPREGNGELRKSGSLARNLAETFNPDEISIGSGVAGEQEPTRGATMADAAKLIAGVKYLLKLWIPYGMVTGVVAEPGIGKSAFVLWLARSIVKGESWFTDQKALAPGYVLWLATENDMALTIQRMQDWDIPTEKVILPFADDPLKPVNLCNTEHLALVESLINGYKTRAVVVDSLRGGHDTDENSSRVGRVLQSLAGIAERTGAAVLVVHHTRKLMVDEEITANSSRGSNAILAMMRSQIGIDRPDPASKWCRVRVLKENLGIAPKPVGFLITNKGLEFGEAPRHPRKRTRKQDAEEWLQQTMDADKWHSAREMTEKAKEAGFSANAVQRAREALGITQDAGTIRQQGDGTYEWLLPGTGGNQP